MNHIPKCSSKFSIHHQAKDIKPSQKEFAKENLAQKISKKMLKFSASRYFGKDITNNSKSNIHSIYNNHCTKVVTIVEKKQNGNNIYIKKHSSASQVVQKPQKIKNNLDEKKIRENKSNFLLNKKETAIADSYYNKNIKKENQPPSSQIGTKLHSSISFGINYNNRPGSTSNNNKSISVRISNPKNYSNNNSNKFNSSLNNRSINNIHNNNDKNNNNNNNNISGHNYNFSYTNNINKITNNNNNSKHENLNNTHNTLDIM